MRTGHRSANGHVTRDATAEPCLTQTTHAEQALVMRNNNSRGDKEQMLTPGHEPVRTLTTSGHQSLVMANTQNGVPRPAAREPGQTLRTEGGLAIVVPYTRTGEPRWAEERPLPTFTTRDRAAVVWSDEAIDDCLFRMFALHEIAGAMAMSQHVDGRPYTVLGNKRERMAMYGQAVTPPAMALIVSRLLEVL
jgi:DNA (cytosine-5)-methyltransferase 1